MSIGFGFLKIASCLGGEEGGQRVEKLKTLNGNNSVWLMSYKDFRGSFTGKFGVGNTFGWVILCGLEKSGEGVLCWVILLSQVGGGGGVLFARITVLFVGHLRLSYVPTPRPGLL